MSNDFLWVEKYRPKTIAETILPKSLKETFQKIVDSGELPNMLLSGTAGLGKTTVAKALCNELDLDYIVINGSEEGNIDTLRGKIKQFASSISLQGGYKVVILDEADYLNPQSTQPALRGFIEEFSNNCRFILTCNFKNRIIEPLHSRCGVYEFNTTKKDMVSLCEMFMDRACTILDAESVEYDKKVLPPIIMKFAPDWRRILNELQRGSHTGFVVNESTTSYDDLFEHLKSKDFKKMRAWVVNNIDTDAAAIFRAMYDRMSDKVDPQSIPQLVLILADYQYKNAFVADHELNVVACLTEVMANVKFS
jgi:DNA polymerase III delta prime subunit